MPLLNYTTKVDIFTTLGQIQGMLVKHGAKKILQEYDDNGRIVAVSFIIKTPNGEQAIRLPAKVDAVLKVQLFADKQILLNAPEVFRRR